MPIARLLDMDSHVCSGRVGRRGPGARTHSLFARRTPLTEPTHPHPDHLFILALRLGHLHHPICLSLPCLWSHHGRPGRIQGKPIPSLSLARDPYDGCVRVR